MSSRSVSATNGVVDVQDNLSANLEIEEASGVTSKELNFSRHFGTSEEDEFNTVPVTSKATVVVDNPDKFDALNDRDDLSRLSRRAKDKWARVCQVLEEDNFQGSSDKETSFGDDELEGSITVVACGDGAVAGRSIKGILRASANLSSAWAESVEVSIDDSNDGKVNLVGDSNRCLSNNRGSSRRSNIGSICGGGAIGSTRGDYVQSTGGARSRRVTRVGGSNIDSRSLCAINSNGNGRGDCGGGSLTLTKLEEEEFEDLNNDCDANANAAVNNDTGTSDLGDFASLSDGSVSNGNGLDLDIPEGIGHSRCGGTGGDRWGGTDDSGSSDGNGATSAGLCKERGRCSVGNCDGLGNNGAVRFSSCDSLCDNQWFGFVEDGNEGNHPGDATNIDSLRNVEDLNGEAGNLRWKSRLDCNSRSSRNCSNVLGSDCGNLNIDSLEDSCGNDNVVRKCSRNDSNGDGEISIDSDCGGLSDNLNNRRSGGLDNGLGSLTCSDNGIESLGDDNILVLPVDNVHRFSDRADHLTSFPTVCIIVCPDCWGREVCGDCHKLAGCQRECSRWHWPALSGQ